MRFVALPLLLASAIVGGGDDLQIAGGTTFSLPNLLARGPVVLVFWNSWLPHAEEFAKLLPGVESAAERHGWPGAVIVFQERRSEVGRDFPALKGTLPFVFDRRGELVRRFQVTRAPAVLLVEKDGKVRARCGPDPAEVQAIVREMAQR
jgi:thiol-disulfide isomerase/thioredoxin